MANVSHELKTPMGALGLLAETLVSEPDVQVAQRLASRIHTEAFRVSRIIDDLLDLSRIESEEAPPREPVLVSLVMAEAVERVRASADQRAISITMDEPDSPVAVLGDRRQLVSAMHALLENAITYSYDESVVTVSGKVVREHSTGEPSVAAGGENGDRGWRRPASPSAWASERLLPAGQPAAITAGTAPNAASSTAPGPDRPARRGRGGSTAPRTKAQEPPVAETTTSLGDEPTGQGRSDQARPVAPRDTVRIAVSDHGIGIPARDLDRIFERFYRVDHGRSRDTGGTGLGLSIVRHVANNHQGWVDVESREGEGSTFTLVLPLQPDHLP